MNSEALIIVGTALSRLESHLKKRPGNHPTPIPIRKVRRLLSAQERRQTLTLADLEFALESAHKHREALELALRNGPDKFERFTPNAEASNIVESMVLNGHFTAVLAVASEYQLYDDDDDDAS